jgi:hypothetical protein
MRGLNGNFPKTTSAAVLHQDYLYVIKSEKYVKISDIKFGVKVESFSGFIHLCTI